MAKGLPVLESRASSVERERAKLRSTDKIQFLYPFFFFFVSLLV